MKIGGQILWNITPICETSQIYYLMVRRPMKDVLGNHFKDRLFHLVHWLSITQKLRRTSQESINLERKSYLDCSSDTHCTRREFGRVTYWLQILRSWRRWTHQKSTQKDSMRKRWYFPKKKESLFSNRRWTNQNPSEEIKTWEHPPWYGSDHFKERVTLIFLENQKGLFHHLTTHFRMLVKRLMMFGPCQETSYTAITLNPESNFTRREKNHSLFHWSTLTYPELLVQIWMSNKRNASTIIGMLMVKRLVGSLDRFHPVYFIGRKTSRRIYMVKVEINEKTADIQARSFMARNLENNGERMPSWRRSKSGRMRSSIWITHENCKGSIPLTRRIRNSKKPSRMLVRNWKHLWLLLCPAKLWRRIVGVVHPIKLLQDLRVFWKLMNPKDCVCENHYQIIMKIILQENVVIHYSITIWFTNLFLCLKP